MMVPPKREVRLSSYTSYLKFKHIIDVIRESPCSRVEIARKLDMTLSSTWHVIRILVKLKVIELIRYEIDKGGKRGIYKLVKDE